MSVNLRKKALLPAISMVTASVIALSGVSYAWFTMGNNAELANLDVQVQAATGMQISMDAANWKSILTKDDITGILDGYTANKNQFPEKDMKPVSTDGTVESGAINMFLGTIEKDGSLSATKEADAKGITGNYIAFDLFFKMAQDNTIYLATDSAVTDSSSAAQTHLASRVAFVNLGVAEAPADAQNLLGTGDVTIWEPNAETHTNTAKVTHNIADEKVPYKGVASEGTPAGLSSADMTTISPKNFGPAVSEAQILELKKGINKVRIYIWVEGQDADCNNDISTGGFSTLVKFEQPASTTP